MPSPASTSPQGASSRFWMTGRRPSPDTTCTTPAAIRLLHWPSLSKPCVKCRGSDSTVCFAQPRRTPTSRQRGLMRYIADEILDRCTHRRGLVDDEDDASHIAHEPPRAG